MDIRVFKQVPRVAFGRGAFGKLADLIEDYRKENYIVFILDHVHKTTKLIEQLPNRPEDCVLFIDTTDEPKTSQVDDLRDEILNAKSGQLPGLVVGIGGGSAMDIAKAISVMLTNEGSSTLYQGWDLVKNKAVSKMAIPTLSGTGAEASRTAVLTGVDKKFGINSDQSMFDLVLMDPDLIENVPRDQRFYTGMDCYIHCVESIEGSFINAFGKAQAKEALSLCEKVFLNTGGDNECLMVASYLGGASVANSEVGVAHAMSYGLSLVLGYHHGIANCIVFNQLDEFYPNYVPTFRKMMETEEIELPVGITANIKEDQLEAMVEMTRKMKRPLISALGDDWQEVLTEEKIRDLYLRM
ncbi:iron-containing alcohol dehydrogenase [Nitrospina gracilis]|nr:iron-containing alcohol dehydrogenase [Nitrospina gracilis]